MQSERERQKIVDRVAESSALYLRLTPESRVKLCGRFTNAGDGRFSYNPDAINYILIANGDRPFADKEDFVFMEETCRYYTSERQAEEVRLIIRDKLSLMGSPQYL